MGRIHGQFEFSQAKLTERKKNGASDQIRTGDPFITNELLYQLSYAGSQLRPKQKGR